MRLLARRPEPADRVSVAVQLAGAFSQLNGPGQLAALDLEPHFLPPPPQALAPELLKALLAMMAQGSQSPLAEVRLRALQQLAALPDAFTTAEVQAVVREMIGSGLRGSEPSERILAIGLAQDPNMELLQLVTPLLHDADLEVRRKALAAVSTNAAAIGTDELLRWLHDPDADVRQLCEAALVWRGLTPEQIRRGRLLTDPRPEIRLQVLVGLEAATDLDPAIWLRHLSHDTEPAVRVAAVRAAAEMPRVDLTDRLQQMAHGDPSDTVRQVSRFYLSCPQSHPE
jgi:HEAT repeat protein